MIKKLSFDTRFEILRFTIAILIAIVLSFLIILLVSSTPIKAFLTLLLGPLGSFRRFGNVIELAITLSFTGLAISLIFSANQFNLAPEGAFYISGAFATFLALIVPLPPVIAPIVAILFGGLVGAIACAIPGYLKQKWGADVLVSSLMLNFAFLYIALYFVNGIFRDPNAGYNATFKIPDAFKLPKIIPGTRIHFGLFIIIIILILSIIYIKKTRWGYELIQTGRNEKFAKYVGVNTGFVIMSTQIIGGFIAGVGGSVEVLGMYDRFHWQELPGYGFDGVIVAILAKNKPEYVPIAAFFLSYLRIGADRMATSTDVTSEMIAIIQGVIIMLVAATAFLSKTRQKMLIKEVSNG